MPVDNPTAAQLTERYLFLRDHIEEQSKKFTEWSKPYREEMEHIAGQLHRKLLELGGDKPSIKTLHGTAFLTTTKNPKVENRDEYIDFCLDNWETVGNAMLQIGTPQVSALNDYMDAHDGNLPPGVKVEPFTKVTVRKS